MPDTIFGIINEAFDHIETNNDHFKHDNFDESDKDPGCNMENRKRIIKDKSNHEEIIASKTNKNEVNEKEVMEIDHAIEENHVKTDAVLDFIYKLRGPAFRSMREKKLKRIWRRASLKEEEGEAEICIRLDWKLTPLVGKGYADDEGYQYILLI